MEAGLGVSSQPSKGMCVYLHVGGIQELTQAYSQSSAKRTNRNTGHRECMGSMYQDSINKHTVEIDCIHRE